MASRQDTIVARHEADRTIGSDPTGCHGGFSVADSRLRAPGEEGRTSSPRPVSNRATLAQETVTALAAHLRSDNASGKVCL